MAQNLLDQTATQLLGSTLDCNLATGAKIGGGTATDNTVGINKFFAASSTTAVAHLLMDGPSTTSGIKILNGNTTIQGIGLGSGFFIKAGANNHGISTEVGADGTGFPPFDPATTPPAQIANIILRDFYINGNRGNGTTGDSTSGDPRGISGTVWYCVLDLISVDNLLIDNVSIYNSPSYTKPLVNVSNFTIRGCLIVAPSGAINTDTIHIDGPASFGVITGCTLEQAGDDGIALNDPEGFGGNISNIAISDCLFNGTLTAVRCYTYIATQYTVSFVTITNCNGVVSHAAFLLGANGSTVDAIQSWKASNCTFACGVVFVEIVDDCGDLDFYGCTWDSPVVANPFVYFDEAATVSSLVLSKCKIYRTTRGNAAAYGLAAAAASTIKKLTIDGFDVDNESGESYAAIPYLIDMANLTITELVINSLDSTLITALVNPVTGFTGIGSISGPGVLNSGFQIPDSVMANNCNYISATGGNAGKPCIKLSGTVFPYTI